jgi:hypothetical protein
MSPEHQGRATVAVADDTKVVSMKLLTTIAALSIATMTTAAANSAPIDPAAGQSASVATTTAEPAQLMLADRRRYSRRYKCQEDLGYGRTSSWGCG